MAEGRQIRPFQVGVRLALGVSVVLWAASVSAQPITTSHSLLYTFQDDAGAPVDPQAVPGSKSELTRSDNLLCGSIYTHNLPMGAYTMWWVIFNNPNTCLDPYPAGGAQCSEPDLFVDGVGGTALWATAGVVGPDSIGHFSACLYPGVENAPGLVFFGPAWENLLGSEIWLILKWHGQAAFGDAAQLHTQLTTPAGLEPPCNAEELPGICPDPQVAIHPAGGMTRGDCNGDGTYDARDIHGIDC